MAQTTLLLTIDQARAFKRAVDAFRSTDAFIAVQFENMGEPSISAARSENGEIAVFGITEPGPCEAYDNIHRFAVAYGLADAHK